MKNAVVVYAVRMCLAGFALLLLPAMGYGQQDKGSFPKATSDFQPKVTYELPLDSAWAAVLSGLNSNSIPVGNASKDARQITTDYKNGPAEGDGFFAGKLITRYKFVISFVPTSATRTTINISPILEARRLAAGLGKILAGNNAISDQMWFDVTAENTAAVRDLKNWLYEQVETAARP